MKNNNIFFETYYNIIYENSNVISLDTAKEIIKTGHCNSTGNQLIDSLIEIIPQSITQCKMFFSNNLKNYFDTLYKDINNDKDRSDKWYEQFFTQISKKCQIITIKNIKKTAKQKNIPIAGLTTEEIQNLDYSFIVEETDNFSSSLMSYCRDLIIDTVMAYHLAKAGLKFANIIKKFFNTMTGSITSLANKTVKMKYLILILLLAVLVGILIYMILQFNNNKKIDAQNKKIENLQAVVKSKTSTPPVSYSTQSKQQTRKQLNFNMK